MPPKDTIFSNGPCEISFTPLDTPAEFSPLGEVIADSLSIEADDAPTASIPALTTGRYKFTVGDTKYHINAHSWFVNGCRPKDLKK